MSETLTGNVCTKRETVRIDWTDPKIQERALKAQFDEHGYPCIEFRHGIYVDDVVEYFYCYHERDISEELRVPQILIMPFPEILITFP